MGRGLERRKAIFERYSSHLSTLINEGELKDVKLEFENSYICPICLSQFTESDLASDSKNMLTLEDSPPDSLGGKKVALTCKSCNSRCGHDLDFHLQEKLLELDSNEFLPNSSQKGKTTIDGHTVISKTIVDDNSIKISLSEKNNDPNVTKDYLKKIIPGRIVNVERKKSRVDNQKFQIAMLKSAYILAFAKFGYNFILDLSFDIVREQLLIPEEQIYPEGFWTKQPFAEEDEGVHFIVEKGYESIFVIFPLKTKSSIRRFGVALPLPNQPIEKVVGELNQRDAGFGLQIDDMGGKEIDYLTDNEAVNKIKKWIKKIHATIEKPKEGN